MSWRELGIGALKHAVWAWGRTLAASASIIRAAGRISGLAVLIAFSSIPAVAEDAADKIEGGIELEKVTDLMNAIVAANREAYSKAVVNRLMIEAKVLRADEQHLKKRVLPLPRAVLPGRRRAFRQQEPHRDLFPAIVLVDPAPELPQNGAGKDRPRQGSGRNGEFLWRRIHRRLDILHRYLSGRGDQRSMRHLPQRSSRQPARGLRTRRRHGRRGGASSAGFGEWPGRGEKHSASGANGARAPRMGYRDAADLVNSIVSANREVYSTLVVDRLASRENVIAVSEHYVEQKCLPLPEQLFNLGAQLTAGRNRTATFALRSAWALNKASLPASPMEKTGLAAEPRARSASMG